MILKHLMIGCLWIKLSSALRTHMLRRNPATCARIYIDSAHTHACTIKKHTVTPLAHTLARTKTYIWQTVSRRVGQLAGIKLDPQVPHCSMGLKAILKASPTVLHQWESMDSGQGKQPGASHTPGGLHLLSFSTLASLCSA